MCIILQQSSYATESIIQIFGDGEAKIGENKHLTVKLFSSDTIGIISGKITGDENVQIIKVNGRNNWNLTYNSETGVFNIYKAEGAKDEEIITIEYKPINENATGRITISNLNATSIDYISKVLPNAEKYIQIKGQEPMQEETHKENQEEITEKVEPREDTNTNVEEEKHNYEDLKNELSIEENSKQESRVIKELPKTGEFNVTIPIIGVCALLGTLFFYIQFNSYKDA